MTGFMKKYLIITSVLLLAIMILVTAFALYNLRDRHKGYWVELDIQAPPPARIHAGFSAVTITPEIIDTWTDTNGNFRYNPEEGDTYRDITGTGMFDAVWMAGFQNRKPAQGVHDDLWARAMVLDDGTTRLAWVVLDAIGFFADDIVEARKRLPANLGVDYAIVSSTHTHSAPDLLGLWGPGQFTSGVNPEYKEMVINQIILSVEQAVTALRPARFRFATDPAGAASMLGDTRKPIVMNPIINIMQAIDSETDSTLGTLVTWDNHPETIWNNNLLITSDYPHFLRKGIEKGIRHNGNLSIKGLGGTAIFAIGNIGGLMTTHPDIPVECLFTGEVFEEPTFDKVKAQGYNLAYLAIQALQDERAVEMETGSISLRAQSLKLPLDNKLFRLGAAIGLFDRGMSGWMQFRSEIAYWTMGPASFLHHPSELYPEIAYGGIEAPEKSDFDIPPIEVPPLQEFMHGDFRFMPGLSNDMIGYVVPKSQWDTKPPYTYSSDSRPYGEINSLGPETGPILHSALLELMGYDKHSFLDTND
ncbi:MAG: hypothetical protein EA359_19020 [Balneolaceae bacterium]|nr:MAG: hypothetical protein EA359_19020 [Balneolaceae bacterium]